MGNSNNKDQKEETKFKENKSETFENKKFQTSKINTNYIKKEFKIEKFENTKLMSPNINQTESKIKDYKFEKFKYKNFQDPIINNVKNDCKKLEKINKDEDKNFEEAKNKYKILKDFDNLENEEDEEDEENEEDDEEDDISDDDDKYSKQKKHKKNLLTSSFISLDLMKNDDDDIKYNLDIIWIDEKVFNSENQSYLGKMKNDYPKIKIQVYDNLEKGFNEIMNLEFVSVFVIISGRLYSKFYQKLKNNLNNIKCIPINIIFTSIKFKKILENKEPDTEQIISYDIQKSINNSFYNSGGVFDNYDEVAKYLNKFNSNFSKKKLKGYLFDLSYEGLFTFNYLKSDNELLAPLLYKDIITKKKISYDEIKKFNQYLLNYGNSNINYLIEPLSLLKTIPIEIICKYWTRVYTIESNFYKEINNKLMKSEIELYDIYIRTLYFGLESKSLLKNTNDKLYRGSMINESEIDKIINSKKQKVIVFCKAFLSFSKKLDVAINFLKRSTINKGSCHIFYELDEIDENEIQNYNISNIEVKDYSIIKNENEILFLPGSSFEIKEIQKNVNINGIDTCKITLGYIGKFSKDFYEIYNNPKKIRELTKNNEIIEPIMKYFFSDKDLFSFDNNDIEYFHNGKYILSKIIINVDPYYMFYKSNKSNDIDEINLVNNLKKTIFPMYLLKNRYNNNYYIANLFYKLNTEKEIFMSNIEFIHQIENPYSLKFVDYFEDNEFYYAIYEYYDETLEDFINRYKKENYSMPVNFIHKILTQLNICFQKMVKVNKFHKDIKPGNIYIIYTDDEKDNFDIRLGGFNLNVDEEGSNHSSCCAGDDYFKAPESLFEGKHDKCDLWSVGVLIYYLSFLKPLNNPQKFRKPNDKDLNDLISKLVVIKPEGRINWENYFSHPFFQKYQ